jgi:hypothetical protein
MPKRTHTGSDFNDIPDKQRGRYLAARSDADILDLNLSTSSDLTSLGRGDSRGETRDHPHHARATPTVEPPEEEDEASRSMQYTMYVS